MSDVVREDRISALETRVAALEAVGSPVDLSETGAAAYDRLKAENARIKTQRDEMVEAADIAIRSLAIAQTERDRLKAQMLRFSEGKDVTNPVWYAKNCLLASAVFDDAILPNFCGPVDEYVRLKAERDVLREFVEAVVEGRVNEWNNRHGVKGLGWFASARHCLRDADEAKTGK